MSTRSRKSERARILPKDDQKSPSLIFTSASEGVSEEPVPMEEGPCGAIEGPG